MSSKLGLLLNLLAEDGGWHSLDEVCHVLRMSRKKVKRIIEVYAGYDFVELDKDGERAKINEGLRKLVLEG